jgi:subtilase family serine protease
MKIQNFRKDGQAFYANVTEARLTGPAASLVEAVSGLDNLGKKPMLKRRIDLRSGPKATYTGNRYAPADFLECGYVPSDMQKAYGLDEVYQQGIRGEGQTIVIVDPFGSPTIQEDANAFSQMTGLPPLTADNFQIVYPLGKPNPFQDDWLDETSLDVEWAHAIAPNAHIVLLVLPSEVEDQDFQFAIFYAALHGLGSNISNSYGCFEFDVSKATLRGYDFVISIAAALGISTNYASGDSGDWRSVRLDTHWRGATGTGHWRNESVDSDLFGNLGTRQSKSRAFARQRCPGNRSHAAIGDSRCTARYQPDQP